MMQTAAVQKISEQNSPYKAMFGPSLYDRLHGCHEPGEKPQKSRQGTPGKKKVFCHAEVKRRCITDFHGRSNKILEGDATIAFITVPLGLSMLLSKEMLIINKYYWKCEEKAERGVQ